MNSISGLQQSVTRLRTFHVGHVKCFVQEPVLWLIDSIQLVPLLLHSLLHEDMWYMSTFWFKFQTMYSLCFIFLPVALVAFPVDSSEDSLFGSDALGGFADKVKGWTETAWSNSKVGNKTTKYKSNHFKQITIQNKTKLHNSIGRRQPGQVRRQGRSALPRLEETLGSGRIAPRGFLRQETKRWPVMPVTSAMTACFSWHCRQWLSCWDPNKLQAMLLSGYFKLH